MSDNEWNSDDEMFDGLTPIPETGVPDDAIAVDVDVVDADGFVEANASGMVFLLPPEPGLCQQCGRDHDPRIPHDRSSLFYNTWFHMRYKRTPRWADAMEHCEDDVREKWIAELHAHGVPMEDLLPEQLADDD